MRRSLATLLSLPEDLYSSIVRSLWTVNTQILTTVVWLLFELIFSRGTGTQLLDATEIRDLAIKSSNFLQQNQVKSRIAKRGVSLINTLLELDSNVERGDDAEFNLKEIISRVEKNDRDSRGQSGGLPSGELNGNSFVDWLSRDAAILGFAMDIFDSA